MLYSIMVMEYGADREVELCELNGNPQPTIDGLKAKTLMVHTGRPGERRRTRIPKYTNIRVVYHEERSHA